MDPKWKGRMGVVDPIKSGPGTWWLMSMVKAFGWEYIEGVMKNKPLILKGSSTASLNLISGEVDLTVPGSEHLLTARMNRGEPVAPIYPKEGLTLKVSRTGICADCPNPNAARLWLDFETSNEAQTLMDKIGGYPSIRSDVKLTYERPPGVLDPKNTISIDDEYVMKNKKEFFKRFNKIMKTSR